MGDLKMDQASRVLIENATIVTVDPEIGTLYRASILIEDGVISKVSEGIADDHAEIIDGSQWIISPGFVDTHRHTWLSTIRHTYGDVDPRRYFSEVLEGAGPRYSPNDVYVSTLLGSYSAISAGTTTLMDWAHIQNTPEHADAGITALQKSNIRAVYGHGWPMTGDDSWTSKNSLLPHPSDIHRIASKLERDDSSLITLALAARGPEMSSSKVWQDEVRVARDLGIRMSIHVGAYVHNSKANAVHAYATEGLLSDDMTFVHCSNTSSEELELIAGAGATVSLGVHCELNSQGIGDIPLDKLLANGIKPSLSGDNETKCSGDMFTQMRSLFGYYRSWVGGGHSELIDPPELLLSDVLEFATLAGAKALGLESSIGSISAGKYADLVCIRKDDINLAPVSNPIAALVLGAHEGNIDSVFIAGKRVKQEGKLVEADTTSLIKQARQSQRRLYPYQRVPA